MENTLEQITQEEIESFKSIFEISNLDFYKDRQYYVMKFIYKEDIDLNQLQSILLQKYDMISMDNIIKSLILELDVSGEVIFSFYVPSDLERSVFYYYCIGSNICTNFIEFRTIN